MCTYDKLKETIAELKKVEGLKGITTRSGKTSYHDEVNISHINNYKNVKKMIEDATRRFNYDNSDSMTDYFDYYSVEISYTDKLLEKEFYNFKDTFEKIADTTRKALDGELLRDVLIYSVDNFELYMTYYMYGDTLSFKYYVINNNFKNFNNKIKEIKNYTHIGRGYLERLTKVDTYSYIFSDDVSLLLNLKTGYFNKEYAGIIEEETDEITRMVERKNLLEKNIKEDTAELDEAEENIEEFTNRRDEVKENISLLERGYVRMYYSTPKIKVLLQRTEFSKTFYAYFGIQNDEPYFSEIHSLEDDEHEFIGSDKRIEELEENKLKAFIIKREETLLMNIEKNITETAKFILDMQCKLETKNRDLSELNDRIIKAKKEYYKNIGA